MLRFEKRSLIVLGLSVEQAVRGKRFFQRRRRNERRESEGPPHRIPDFFVLGSPIPPSGNLRFGLGFHITKSRRLTRRLSFVHPYSVAVCDAAS